MNSRETSEAVERGGARLLTTFVTTTPRCGTRSATFWKRTRAALVRLRKVKLSKLTVEDIEVEVTFED